MLLPGARNPWSWCVHHVDILETRGCGGRRWFKRRMRCPSCGSLETKRNGKTTTAPVGVSGQLRPLQRFLCTMCKTSFTAERNAARPRASFTDEFVLEAVRMYVQGMPSYRTLAALLEPRVGRSISRMTLKPMGAAARRSGQDAPPGVCRAGPPTVGRAYSESTARRCGPPERNAVCWSPSTMRPKTLCTPSWCAARTVSASNASCVRRSPRPAIRSEAL